MPGSGGTIHRILSWLVAFLAASAAYLYTFPQPNIPYAGVVLLHTVAGALVVLLLVPAILRLLTSGTVSSRVGWVLIAAGGIVGLVLIKTGTSRADWNKPYLHIVLSMAGIGLLVAGWLGHASSEGKPRGSRVLAGATGGVRLSR